MPSALLTIGKSGALTARSALELTGQNIANAGSAGYTRRTLAAAEVASARGIGLNAAGSLSGVRAAGIERAGAPFLHAEARRTGSDLARADAELGGLRLAEAAVERAGLYPALTGLEASLARLGSDPLNTALRADALEQARAAAQSFNLAAQGVAAAREGVLTDAAEGVAEVNRLAAELARINTGLAKAQDGSAGKAALLDRRDHLLAQLSGHAAVAGEFDGSGRVAVRLGGTGGPLLVAGGQSGVLTAAQNTSGALQFAVDSAAALVGSGALAGQSQALARLHGLGGELDALAGDLIARSNGLQASGATPAGTAGPPLFSGSGAGDIALALTDGSGIAAAAGGSPAGSRNTANLAALRSALADGSVAEADRLLSTLSAAISGRTVTRDVLGGLANAAQSSLQNAAGVDLDAEAVNLLRFQQAFQANGKVIQAAAEIFDTMLGIG